MGLRGPTLELSIKTTFPSKLLLLVGGISTAEAKFVAARAPRSTCNMDL